MSTQALEALITDTVLEVKHLDEDGTPVSAWQPVGTILTSTPSWKMPFSDNDQLTFHLISRHLILEKRAATAFGVSLYRIRFPSDLLKSITFLARLKTQIDT